MFKAGRKTGLFFVQMLTFISSQVKYQSRLRMGDPPCFGGPSLRLGPPYSEETINRVR